MTPGLHLMHKPVGPTSFSLVQQCIQAVRADRPHNRPRVCHGGTLDPFASGLLMMLVGPATRLFDYLHAIPKIYVATVRWGIETDNGDPHGQVTTTGDPSSLSPQRLDEAVAPFVGWHEQIPPATSAKRVGGERAYIRAHRGETVELPPSKVYLHQAQWLDHDLPSHSRLRLCARGGYYVRAMVRDLGRQLGCGAHITALHRTTIGPWEDPGPDQRIEIRGRALLPWAPSRTLSDWEFGELRQQRDIAPGKIEPPTWTPPEAFPDPQSPLRAFHHDRLVFLLKPEAERLKSAVELGTAL